MDTEISPSDILEVIQLLTQPPSKGEAANLKPGLNPFDWQLGVNLEKADGKLKAQEKYKTLHEQIQGEQLLWKQASQDTRWPFVVASLQCLVKLKETTDAAVAEFKKRHALSAVHPNIGKDSAAPPMSPDTFSFAQNKAISTLLQFIVCLGICPYLQPGVGLPLERRSGFAAALQASSPVPADVDETKRLAYCIKLLLKCSKQSSLGGLILSRHLGDILASLFQICCSPSHQSSSKSTDCIESERKNIVQSCTENTQQSCVKKGSTPDGITDDSEKMVKHQLLADFIRRADGDSPSGMKLDQEFLVYELEKLLQHTYQPMLFKELLILQGGPGAGPRPSAAAQPATKSPNISQAKKKAVSPLPRAPNWLRKICGHILSNLLMGHRGVQNLLRGMLDGSTETFKEGQTPDWSKCDAVAHVIANCPRIVPSQQHYYTNIGKQLLELLHVEDKLVARQFMRVAVTTITAMLAKNADLANTCLLQPLLQPLLGSLEHADIERNSSVQVLTAEGELSQCVNDIHSLVVAGEPQSRLMSALTPVIHPIFLLYCFTTGGISHLRGQCETILQGLLKSDSDTSTLSYLRLMAFDQLPGGNCSALRMHRNTDFRYADSGGLEIIVTSDDSDASSWESWDVRASCVVDLLKTVKREDVIAQFFVSMLKELTQMVSCQIGEDKCGSAPTQCSPQTLLELEKHHEEAVEQFRTNMMVLNVLAKMTETLGPECFKNVLHILDFVEATLEHAVLVLDNTEDATFGAFESETLTMAMGLLTAIIGGALEVSRDDRYAMTRILPILHKIAECHPDATIKLLATDLRIAIATLGHVKLESLSQRYSPKQEASKNDHAEAVKQQPKIEVLSSVETGDKMSHRNVDKKQGGLISGEYECTNSSHQPAHAGADVANRESQEQSSSEICPAAELNVRTSKQIPGVKQLKGSDTPSNVPATEPSTAASSKESHPVIDSKKGTAFHQAYLELHDAFLPVRGHGLIALRKLVQKRDAETLANFDALQRECIEFLTDDDSYIYLGAISLLAALAELHPERLMPELLQHYTLTDRQSQKRPSDFRMKLGEVIMKTFRILGDLMPSYRDRVLSVLMVGARDEDPLIRASCVSNLGEMCKLLRFSLGNIIHEVLNCVSGLLKGDDDVEVRKSAAMFVTLLLQGLGDDALKVLEETIREVYRLLKHVTLTEKDEDVRLHLQMALQELDIIMKRYLFPQQTLTKRIRVKDPE